MTYIRRENIKEPPPFCRPGQVALDPDDSHARYVGWTSDKHQVFVTNVFVPESSDDPGCEYAVRFIFDKSSHLVDMTVQSFGPRNRKSGEDVEAAMNRLFEEFGPIKKKRIHVIAFRMMLDGVEFGLIVIPPGEGEEHATLELHPGNSMSFHVPWNSGVYDT